MVSQKTFHTKQESLNTGDPHTDEERGVTNTVSKIPCKIHRFNSVDSMVQRRGFKDNLNKGNGTDVLKCMVELFFYNKNK